ncbi:MAG: tRNA (adenosine(37)-N6)-dimethylallyltransferase MiaA [Patescibacteria group bacterium]
MKTLPKLISIVGPTATGKSDLAVAVALHMQKKYGKTAEIISTDSRQVYIGLDIGTGKITEEEMKGVVHHMIDIVSPLETYTVFQFAKTAEQIIQDIHARGNIPILCGGTGQYNDALVTGHSGAPVPPNQYLRDTFEKMHDEEVFTYLQKLSKEKECDISQVDIRNKRRMIRAIEIIEAIGHIPKIEKTNHYDVITIGLDMDSEVLRARIEKRLLARLEAGMIEESKLLLEKGLVTDERMQKLGLEYAYISMLLNEQITEAEFKEQLFYAIWHYAKRQRTWFKRDQSITWFDASIR